MEQNRNQTPRANRVHIGFFGRRNAGKSSLINAVAGQTISVVSPVCGTTTDTVEKAMELLPIGAVVLIDTPVWTTPAHWENCGYNRQSGHFPTQIWLCW